MNSTLQHEKGSDEFVLMQVHNQNVRNVQIGGATDGISPDVAKEYGYDPDFRASVEGAGELKQAIAKLSGQTAVEHQKFEK